MVYQREKCDFFRLQDGLELFHCLVHRVIAGNRDDAVARGLCHMRSAD
jgi:hypothetical protein